jgi:hypothetical protein
MQCASCSKMIIAARFSTCPDCGKVCCDERCYAAHRHACKWAAYKELGRVRFVPEPVSQGRAAVAPLFDDLGRMLEPGQERERAGARPERTEQRSRESAVAWTQEIGKQTLLDARLDVHETAMPQEPR